MQRCFADTFYWIALLVRRDDWHERVTASNHTLQREDTSFTTDAVILEFLAAFSSAGSYLRQQAVARVEATRARLLEGLALYKDRLDKEYSLTDCLSMQVMCQEGLTEALTNDHHFTQEGFHILFP